MPSLIPFANLEARKHALTDAGSVAELRQDSDTLTCKLNPSLAQALLSGHEFDITASLNFLERWIVVDQVVVDVVAVDSLKAGNSAIESFQYRADTREAFIAHVTDAVLSDGLGLAGDALNVSLTLIPPDVFDRCVDLLGRTSRAIHDSKPGVPWESFGFGLEKRYGEMLSKFYGGASFLAQSHFGVVRTLVYYD